MLNNCSVWQNMAETLTKADKDARGLGIKEKSQVLHSILDEIAKQRN
jgi:hypothetical protein